MRPNVRFDDPQGKPTEGEQVVDDQLIDLIGPLFTSAGIYPIVFVLAAIDAFFPIVPSESVVITAGVFAASGKPTFVALAASAAFGAYVGDTISYLLGRRAGRRFGALLYGTRRRRKAYAWARWALHKRGGLLIVAARFIPGGRTATTLAAGALGYDQRRFSGFAALAAVLWAVYTTLLGYAGGIAAGNPFEGILLGLGVGVGLTVVIELVRRFVASYRRRRDPTRAADRSADPSGDPSAGPGEPLRSVAGAAEQR